MQTATALVQDIIHVWQYLSVRNITKKIILENVTGVRGGGGGVGYGRKLNFNYCLVLLNVIELVDVDIVLFFSYLYLL